MAFLGGGFIFGLGLGLGEGEGRYGGGTARGRACVRGYPPPDPPTGSVRTIQLRRRCTPADLRACLATRCPPSLRNRLFFSWAFSGVVLRHVMGPWLLVWIIGRARQGEARPHLGLGW